jgi:hypothetical protein
MWIANKHTKIPQLTHVATTVSMNWQEEMGVERGFYGSYLGDPDGLPSPVKVCEEQQIRKPLGLILDLLFL